MANNITISTVGMPLKNQVDQVEAMHTVIGHLNRTYKTAEREDLTWWNRQMTVKVHITGNTVHSDIIFYDNTGYGGAKLFKNVTFQQYYNDIINHVPDPQLPSKATLTEVQRNAIIRGLIKDIDTIRYSAILNSIEKDVMLKNVSESLKVIHDN